MPFAGAIYIGQSQCWLDFFFLFQNLNDNRNIVYGIIIIYTVDRFEYLIIFYRCCKTPLEYFVKPKCSLNPTLEFSFVRVL